MLDYPEYTLGIQARYGEAGTDGKIRLGALANWFQEAAGHNASASVLAMSGFSRKGRRGYSPHGLSYQGSASPGDKVNIRTWPAKLEHLGTEGMKCTTLPTS